MAEMDGQGRVWRDMADAAIAAKEAEIERLHAEIASVRAATLEECAELAQEFGWILPLRETAEMNEAMDDAACDVARQIAEAIRALGELPNAQEKTHA